MNRKSKRKPLKVCGKTVTFGKPPKRDIAILPIIVTRTGKRITWEAPKAIAVRARN